MNAPFRIFDTLQNLVSGLGTSKDKTVHTSYVLPQLDRGQLNNAYRGDWIARKVIDIPAQDATRMWRQWQAENDQIEKLEDYERNLGVQDKIRRAMQRARLYGGAAIVIGTGDDARSEEELDVERLGKDSLKFLHVVSQHDLPADEFETDVMSPYYGEPKFYRRSLPRGEQVKIHPSRVVRFIGAEIPDQMLMNGGVWGDSVLQIVNDAVLSAGSVTAGVAALVQEAKRDVVHIPDLGKHLSTQEYTDKLTSRLMYANSIKSMINTTVLDENEKWEQMQVNFGTLPDVLKMYLMIASGAADIPATRMLGQSPSGMNSTGESDTRNYYDRVRSEQSTVMQPALSRLDEVVIRSALGSRPPEIYYEWNSLWQMTEAEEADLAAKKAANFKIEVDLGLINPDALREVRINQLIEDGTYPGLEAAIEEHGDEPEEQDDEEILGAFAELQKKQKMLAPPEPGGNVTPFQKKRVGDSNPYHEPAGSSKGGQFASKTGGGAEPHRITEKEHEVLYDYVDPKKTGGEFSAYFINRTLLGLEPKGKNSEKMSEIIETMDALLGKSTLSNDTTLYRGFTSKEISKNAESRIDTVLPIKAFQSTTLNRGLAFKFAELDKGFNFPFSKPINSSVILEISVAKGTSALDMRPFSKFDGSGSSLSGLSNVMSHLIKATQAANNEEARVGGNEEEILLGRHGHYVINSVSRGPKGQAILRVRHVDPPPPRRLRRLEA